MVSKYKLIYLIITAIQQRREKIESYDKEMEKFHQSTIQAEQFVNQAREVLWKDLDNITPSKCTQLAEQCQVRSNFHNTRIYNKQCLMISDQSNAESGLTDRGHPLHSVMIVTCANSPEHNPGIMINLLILHVIILLSSRLQDVIRQVPAVDRLLGDLITSSLKLGDACKNADAVSKVN